MAAGAEKLSITEKAGYSLGDCAANFVFQTQIIFLMAFYTDVLRISATAAGLIVLVSRFWDGFNDPMMGALADRTTSRWGKFRPWILFTSLPFGILFVLCYTAPDLSPTGKILWAIITYNALMMIYTANNIPYSALTGVMTGDVVERARLVQWRFVFAMIAQFFVQTFTLTLVDYFGEGDKALGFQVTMGMWAMLAVIFFLITFATTRERVLPNPHQKSSVKQDLSDVFRNPNWVALALTTIFVFFCLAMRGGITYYYFQYFVETKEIFGWSANWETLFGWFNGLGTATTILGVLLSKPLSLRFGKRDTFRACLFGTAICIACFSIIPPKEVETMFALQMLLQFVYGITIPLLWAMMADVADFSEWRNGRRATAMTFALTVFALKVGLSLGSATQGWLLDFYGYVPDITQTQTSLDGIRWMMSIYPAVSFFIAVGALCFYRIDKQMEIAMQIELVERRESYESIP